jgi:16S rRNA (guanine(966)-N(2))-methyltransferase RsmD
MRVIAGKVKGQRLKSLQKPSIRPTTEVIRKALFSILESLVDDWSLVLDIYAGSGALGIEALSRGAGWVDFVEQNSRCCAIIEENLKRTKLISQAQVHCCSANQALSRLNREYSIVLLDPPYSDSSLLSTLEKLLNSSLAGANSTVAVQYSCHQPLPSVIDRFRIAKDRHYGDTRISIYREGGMS